MTKSPYRKITCFKAYDIRGKLEEQLDEDVAYRVGRAFAEFLQAKEIVVGGDVRETSESLKQAVAKGITDAGTNVIDIGMVGTEEVYFATKHYGVDGGIEVTASHNPIDYNGMKLVKFGSAPISGDSGLHDIQKMAESGEFKDVSKAGTMEHRSVLADYVDHLMTYIDAPSLTPMKIVVNAGNGAAGHVIDAIESKFSELKIPVEFVKVHHEPDATFPNGIPNPLLVENRGATRDAVLQHKAQMGVAWDGDFDRCFLFDERGEFIEGYYIVGLLAQAFLDKNPGQKIIHDPRLTWNTQDIVTKAGGVPIMSKTGHAFIKERMREEDAVYGGEMSAHHYFRDFAYCDSGMIPWLLVAELMSSRSTSLSSLVEAAMSAYPSSGEINSKLADPAAAIAKVKAEFEGDAADIDYTDGLSISFSDWRFNLRSSNTEPVVRLNVESRGNEALMKEKTEEILSILRG